MGKEAGGGGEEEEEEEKRERFKGKCTVKTANHSNRQTKTNRDRT